MGNLTAKEESQPNTTNNTSEGNNKVNMNNTNNTSNTNKKNNNTPKNSKIVEEEELLNKILSKSQSLIKNYKFPLSCNPVKNYFLKLSFGRFAQLMYIQKNRNCNNSFASHFALKLLIKRILKNNTYTIITFLKLLFQQLPDHQL